MTIKRVGPLSCAKIAAALYAAIGLVLGVIFSLGAMAGAMVGGDSGAGGIGMIFGVGSIVLLPIVYGCIGFVGTLLMAYVYNALASAVGGIEVDIS
jgi:ABC-type glucose/galactose transport system permease subunit